MRLAPRLGFLRSSRGSPDDEASLRRPCTWHHQARARGRSALRCGAARAPGTGTRHPPGPVRERPGGRAHVRRSTPRRGGVGRHDPDGRPPALPSIVVGVPVLALSAWLLVPFFVNERVFEEFPTSIASEQVRSPADASPAPDDTSDRSVPPTTAVETSPTTVVPSTTPAAPPVPAGPRLLGSGTIIGLAGHDGTGDAGIFRLDDDALVVRLENLDIDNGPDLELYLVPGEASYSPGADPSTSGRSRGTSGTRRTRFPVTSRCHPDDGPCWCGARRSPSGSWGNLRSPDRVRRRPGEIRRTPGPAAESPRRSWSLGASYSLHRSTAELPEEGRRGQWLPRERRRRVRSNPVEDDGEQATPELRICVAKGLDHVSHR